VVSTVLMAGVTGVSVCTVRSWGLVGLMVIALFILWCTYLIARHSTGRVTATLSQVEAWWEVHIWKVGEAKQGPGGVSQHVTLIAQCY